jgi:DNA-binding MarR family transcriptional regulator
VNGASPAAPSAPATEAEVAARLRMATGRLARRLRLSTAGGLTPSQVSTLAVIARHGPIGLGELADREAMSPPTLSRIVGRLLDLGYVRRQTNTEDRRSARVQLTPRGRRAVERMRAERTSLLVARLHALPADERAALVAALPVLEALADDLPAAPPPPPPAA